MDTTNTEW